MAEFPYTPKPSSLPVFLDKIQSIGVPDKVTLKYITSIGFKSKNDRYISGILKRLGFTDSSGVPMERWKAYRDTRRGPAELASAIREAYADLFAVYPDAYRKDDEALGNFFTSSTSVGEKAVSMMVSTFKTLCGLADFTATPRPSPVPPVPTTESQVSQAVAPAQLGEAVGVSQGITINVNIQLTLPETKDSSVYDSIFESLKKHLLS
jgi:hypothetical protein